MNERPPESGIAEKAVRGVLWSGGGQLTRQLIQLPTSILLARLLLPEDFGLIGMAMVFVAIAQLISDFGIGAAIVQSREIPSPTVSAAFWANVVFGAVLCGLLCLLAAPVGVFYGEPRVTYVMFALSASLLLAAMTTVPRALLQRRMDFRGDSRANVFGTLGGALIAVASAAAGLGVWSLVLQAVATNLLILLLTLLRAAWWPALVFSWSRIRELVRFSAGVFGSNLLAYATRHADNLLIGRFLGSTPLGFYAMAYRLMLFPLSQVSDTIGKVMFPALTNMIGDLPRFRRSYLMSVAGIATVTFPMMLGLLAVVEDFIIVVLSPAWLPMQTVLSVFCVVGLLQSIGTTVGTIYLSTGRTRRMFLVNLCFAPIYLAAFATGLRWGIEGVAIAYATVSATLLYVSLKIAFDTVGLKLSGFHRALLGPTSAAVSMYLVIAVARRLLIPVIDNAAVRLGLLVTGGIVAYGLASMVFNRSRIFDLIARLRTAVVGA